MSNYEVTMSNYYEKSANIKNGMQTTIDDVQQNFLDKVSTNIETIDSQDQQTLLARDSYTSAVSGIQAANDGPLPKLTQMSTENDGNPMNPIVKTDREYKEKFQNFTDGKRSEEINAEVKEIEFTFEARKQVEYWLSIIPEDFNPELIKRIKELLDTDPRKAFEKLYGSKDLWEKIFTATPANQEKYLSFLQKLEDFPGYTKFAQDFLYKQEWLWELLYKNEKLENIFFALVSSPGAAQRLPAKISEKLYSSDWFFKALDKGPEWLQSRVLSAMAAAEDGTFWSKMLSKGQWVNEFFGKVSGYVQKFKSGKLAQAVSKLIKSPLAKKLTENPIIKKLTGPWGGMIIDAGFSGYQAYNNPKDPAYHSIGKSAFSGSIDAVKNASIIDGALIGATYGGVWGAVAGVGVVLVKDLVGWAIPDWDKHVKNGFNSVYDSVANSEVGKGITNTVNSVKTTVGNAFHEGEKVVKNVISDAIKTGFTGGLSLGWFG